MAVAIDAGLEAELARKPQVSSKTEAAAASSTGAEKKNSAEGSTDGTKFRAAGYSGHFRSTPDAKLASQS